MTLPHSDGDAAQTSRTLTLQLTPRLLYTAISVGLLGCFSLAILFSLGGWMVWRHWDHGKRLTQARQEATLKIGAELARLSPAVSQLESAALRITLDLEGARRANRASSIVPARYESDVSLHRSDLDKAQRALRDLKEIEAQVRTQYRLEPSDGLLSAADERLIEEGQSRVRAQEDLSNSWTLVLSEVKQRKETLQAQAREAAQTRAREEARRQANYYRPDLSPRFIFNGSPGYSSYDGYGYGYARRSRWDQGGYYGNPFSYSRYGYGHRPDCRRSRASGGFGVSLVFR